MVARGASCGACCWCSQARSIRRRPSAPRRSRSRTGSAPRASTSPRSSRCRRWTKRSKIVNLTLFVDPGSRVYVRHINFTGTTRSDDESLRRELRQLEGAWLSNVSLERSKQRLQRLAVRRERSMMTTDQVPGSPTWSTCNFAVKERPSATIGGGIGYSASQKLVLNANLSDSNFFGWRRLRGAQYRFRRLQQDLQLQPDRSVPQRRRAVAHHLAELSRLPRSSCRSPRPSAPRTSRSA